MCVESYVLALRHPRLYHMHAACSGIARAVVRAPGAKRSLRLGASIDCRGNLVPRQAGGILSTHRNLCPARLAVAKSFDMYICTYKPLLIQAFASILRWQDRIWRVRVPAHLPHQSLARDGRSRMIIAKLITFTDPVDPRNSKRRCSLVERWLRATITGTRGEGTAWPGRLLCSNSAAQDPHRERCDFLPAGVWVQRVVFLSDAPAHALHVDPVPAQALWPSISVSSGPDAHARYPARACSSRSVPLNFT